MEEAEQPNRRPRGTVIALACAAVIVAAGIVLAVLLAMGVVWPSSAAAKYGLYTYVSEEAVTTYIMGFKNQSGYAEASDEEWATFLSESNLTPEALRVSAINEVLKNDVLQEKADELGIRVEDGEVQEELDELKSATAFDDDEIWADTLAMYGQTEEGIHEKYRLDILKRKVCVQEVAVPEPTDYQVKQYIASEIPLIETGKAKHSYCFKILGLNEKGSLTKMQAVQKARDAMAAEGASAEAFAAALEELSDVEDLRERGGANGWDVDRSEYSDAYCTALDELGEDGLSKVFNDGDGYAFIWVDEVYDLPQSAEELSAMDLSEMPESLHEYFSDCEAHVLWQVASDEYVQSLVERVDPLFFPMPEDVPYNVDMSLARQQG